MTEPNYFGCWPRFGAGHFLYLPNGDRVWTHPLGTWMTFDTLYAPHQRRPGIWRQTVLTDKLKQEFTLLGCWDRTGDERPASNSLFLLPGNHPFPISLELSREHFGEVVERIAASFPNLYRLQ
jgi:hypothetical protein